MTIPTKKKANKRLGQHWMVDRFALDTMVTTLEIAPGDTVIEIGPGRGALTKRLVGAGAAVTAIEKDPELALSVERLALKGLEIIQGDVRKELPEITKMLHPKPYKLIGNIPYYLTGALLRQLIELPHPPTIAVLTIQKEVALRIAAKVPRMNLLAAIVQYGWEVEIVKHLKPTSFAPPPKVSSSIIKLRAVHPFDAHYADYISFISEAFSHARKQLLGNLKSFADKDRVLAAFKQMDLPDTIRAHGLSIEQLKAIQQYLK